MVLLVEFTRSLSVFLKSFNVQLEHIQALHRAFQLSILLSPCLVAFCRKIHSLLMPTGLSESNYLTRADPLLNIGGSQPPNSAVSQSSVVPGRHKKPQPPGVSTSTARTQRASPRFSLGLMSTSRSTARVATHGFSKCMSFASHIVHYFFV
jgi:hypothetical protein